MIIETIISSIDKDGKVNFAPIGVHVSDNMNQLSQVKEIRLFLFSGSKTFSNLMTGLEGVANFSDDSMAFVETALFSKPLPAAPSLLVSPPRMACAKTIWEFSITDFDYSREPARVKGRILHYEELAGFRGFCRAHGVILEATIMATRLQWISKSEIMKHWPLWQDIVFKTGGPNEQEAFRKVTAYFIHKGIPISTS